MIPGVLFAGSQFRQFVLALLISTLAAVAQSVFARFSAPEFRQVGALPDFTEAWLRWYPWAWCIPVLVLLIWMLKLWAPRSGTVALALAYFAGLLINAVAIMAAWLSVFALPAGI